MSDEVWKPVVGYEGLYEVSDRGQIRSLRRKTPIGMRGGRVLKLSTEKPSGRKVVKLCALAVATRRKVHHIVLEAFVGPRPEGLIGCHKDGDPGNNAASNLRWDTHASNHADMELHGTRYRGRDHHRAKVDESLVAHIRSLLSSGTKQSQIVRELGLSKSLVSRIARRTTWRHVDV